MTTSCTERKISSTWVLSGLWNGVCCRSKSTLRGCCQRFSLVFSRWNLACILTLNFEDKSLQIKPNKKTNKEWRAMFSQKHWDFSIFSWRHDVTDWSHSFFRDSLEYNGPIFSQNIQKCIFRFLWLTEVLHREVCLILIVKYVWWRNGNWVTEFVRETVSFGLWTWMVNNRS